MRGGNFVQPECAVDDDPQFALFDQLQALADDLRLIVELLLHVEQHRRQHHDIVDAQVVDIGGFVFVVAGGAHQRYHASVGRHQRDGLAEGVGPQVIQRDVETLPASPGSRCLSKIFRAIGDGPLRAETLYQLDLFVGADSGSDPRAAQRGQLNRDVSRAAGTGVDQHGFSRFDLRPVVKRFPAGDENQRQRRGRGVVDRVRHYR